MFNRKTLYSLVSLLIVLSLVFTLTGCGAKTEAPQQSAQTNEPAGQQPAVSESTQIIEAAAKYLGSELSKTPTISPQDVYNNVVMGGDTGYFLVSLQKPEDYAAGHVKGAINIPFGKIAKEENLKKIPKDKKIVLICYTGHTASYASMLLNELGYEAYAMKFGMNGWSSDPKPMGTVKFFTKPADFPVDTTPVEAQPTNELPALATGKTAAADIIIAAADKYLSSELSKTPTISPQDVYNNVVMGGDQGYVLVSLQKPEDYAAGHVKGAINIPYGKIAAEENLKKLAKDKKIVLICYTGHTASYASMLLNQLGYEAYAMKFGMNGWSSDPKPMGTVKFFTKPAAFPVVAGTNP